MKMLPSRVLKQLSTFGTRVPETRKTTGYKVPRPVCAKCGGLGKRAAAPTHKPDCKCIKCLPCKDCEGTGRVKGQPRVRSERSIAPDPIDDREEG